VKISVSYLRLIALIVVIVNQKK